MATTYSGGATYNPDKAGTLKLPDVPEAQLSTPLPIDYPATPDPYDMFKLVNQFTRQGMKNYPNLVNMQLGMMPQVTAAQLAASQYSFPTQLWQQQRSSEQAFNEMMRQAQIASPAVAGLNWNNAQKYAPLYGELLRGEGQKTAEQLQAQMYQFNPEFMANYKALGGRIGEGLEAGYNLGPDLEREVQQGIRAAQTSRGNYMGPAATAAEAYGVGHAATDLYNTRIGQAQNFLAGPSPTDKWSGLMQQYGPAGTAMGMVGQTAQPGLGYQTAQIAPTASSAAQMSANFLQNPIADYTAQGLQGYGTYQNALTQWGGQSIQGQLGYNSNMIESAKANNEGTFNMYDKQFEQFLFDQSVSQGLYSQPSVGGGGGAGGMQMAGQIGGAVVGAAGSVASAAAATGALAAICWLARAVLPERWKEFRAFLFTKAPAWFRKKYIFGARRLARGLTKADKAQIRETMRKCLQ